MEFYRVTILLTWLVEAMEIQWVTNCTDLAGGSDVILAPILLTPVGGGHGILPGHKIY